MVIKTQEMIKISKYVKQLRDNANSAPIEGKGVAKKLNSNIRDGFLNACELIGRQIDKISNE